MVIFKQKNPYAVYYSGSNLRLYEPIVMAHYSIKDIEQLTGIRSHTLRIWERRYEIAPIQRTDTNIRVYTDNDLKYFLQTSILLNSGFRISKILQMSEGERIETIERLSDSSNKDINEFYINQLILAMIELDESLFHRVLQQSFDTQGIEISMFGVIFPFLEKVGLMWLLSTVNPAQEHFISNLIRQKILTAIDNLPPTSYLKSDSHKFILFLPQDELHEISLLFLNYMLRVKRKATLYLGQNTPFHHVKEALTTYPATHIFTIVTSYSHKQVTELLEQLSTFSNEYKVLVTGRSIAEVPAHTYPDITFLFSGRDIVEWLHDNC